MIKISLSLFSLAVAVMRLCMRGSLSLSLSLSPGQRLSYLGSQIEIQIIHLLHVRIGRMLLH